MRLLDVLILSIKTLSEKKLRATLTIIGVAIGPLALIMIGSVVSGYGSYIVSNIMGLGQNMIVVTPSSNYRLTQEDLSFLSSLEGVVEATQFFSMQGEIYMGGSRKTVFIYGVDPAFVLNAIGSLRVLEGDVPSRVDLGKALVGYNIAHDEFGNKVYEIGDVLTITTYQVKERGRIEIRRLNVVIVGILDKYGGAAFLNPDITIFVHFDTLERMLGIKEWSGILLLAESPEKVDEITNTIRNIYKNNVDVISFLAIARMVSSVISAVDFISFAASTSAFAVAVAGIASTMITSVIERTREIGVMKALGFKDRQVLMLIILEGLCISFIGCAIGIAMGIVGAHVLSRHGVVISGGTFKITIEASPEFTPQLFMRAVLMTLSVGLLGSIFPAYRAMKIPPVMALRYE
ncbi:MAG: FtsX-like permease family protein [Desulfurococcaceae archaeon]